MWFAGTDINQRDTSALREGYGEKDRRLLSARADHEA